MIQNVLIGSDVEYFVIKSDDGTVVSAEGMIKGTKHEPFHFAPRLNPYFATSLDNVLAEGNIPPARKAIDFIDYLSFLRKHINRVLPAGFTTAAIASARLDEKYLQSEHAKTFGCDPSFNCWTNEIIEINNTGDNLRSAGFHIHVGYENPCERDNLNIAKAMDLFLGVPSILVEPENERRIVGYGVAGNFRHQPHGVEYRSLSSYFSSTNDLIEWCFEQTMKAVHFVNADRMNMLNGDKIQAAINGNDRKLASDLVEDFDLVLP